ncbi:Hypothetical protein PENO1_085530 [Penicillium occitanis (nom. inval.)]|nr:Hypothetical protein PENO1_085530 [Penicillium occitanis (nom. inval.)]PCG93249.1 hypothetical protein PENOC_088490 [Penicillium occitanis (nom. inval.)]
MTHGIGKLIDAERTAARQDSVLEMISKDIENQFTANALNVDRRKLTNVLAGIVDILRSEEDEEQLLSLSRTWYEKRKKEEEEKGKKLPNTDVIPRKEPPTTLTITPSKTLINSLNQNPGDYFDAELGNLTLKPIAHPQSLSANIFPESLQTPNELLFSPLKASGSSVDQGGYKLQSIHDILTNVTPHRRDDLVLRTRPDNTSSEGGLPGVESFDHAVASMKLLDLVAKLQNSKGDLSHEEKKFCQEIAANLEVKGAQDISKSEEDLSAKTYIETTEKDYKMAKEGPKQEGFGCPVCLKSFNRLSVLKYNHHSPIKTLHHS